MDERPRFRQARPLNGPHLRGEPDPRDEPYEPDERFEPDEPDEQIPRRAKLRPSNQRESNQRLAPIPPRSERSVQPLLRRSERPRRWMAPFPVAVALALVGSSLFIITGIINRAADQIPILCAGLAVFGLTMAAIAVFCVLTVVRSARVGRDANAFWAALAGGVATLGAAGALSAAVVLALVWSSARP